MADPINIKPGHGKGGRHPTAETLAAAAKSAALAGHEDPGMFGRMFSNLPALKVPDAALQELADAMTDPSVEPQPADANGKVPADKGDNERIPSGFTYLGQFIDHDITLDLTSLAEKEEDPLATQNFRTPRLDLDALYGLGPDGSPQLYARNTPDAGATSGPKFLIGKTTDTGEGVLRNDVPRSPEGFAIIGDHRNDENLLVQQTHLALLKFHNKVVDMLAKGKDPPPATLFPEARKLVTWHYQWMVLHDFVERLTPDGMVAKILTEGRRFYRFKKVPYMPVEFSAAAYRLGHSMVRDAYTHNRIFDVTDLSLMFTFTGLSGILTGEEGSATFPSNWVIDWRRYHEVKGAKSPGLRFNFSRKIDPNVIELLHTLPGDGGSLPFRNLKRGVNLGLPSGQDVAKHMQIKNPLTAAEIADGSPDGKAAKKHGLHEKTPLWYYILKEAQKKEDGKRLGPVGATIVAEVFVGLVAGDKGSYLNQKNWKPTLPAKKAGTFTMADLLNFVDDLNPLGDESPEEKEPPPEEPPAEGT